MNNLTIHTIFRNVFKVEKIVLSNVGYITIMFFVECNTENTRLWYIFEEIHAYVIHK